MAYGGWNKRLAVAENQLGRALSYAKIEYRGTDSGDPDRRAFSYLA
jgi:hypothetical protein